MTYGVIRAEPFFAGKSRNVVETFHKIGGEGQEFLHFLRVVSEG